MTAVRYIEITLNETGQRVDNYLFRILKGVPKSHIYRLIRGGEVRINKKRVVCTYRLQLGDTVRIPPVRTAESRTFSISSELKNTLQKAIIYEDEALLVINKPAGLATHGGSGLSLGLIEAIRMLQPEGSFLELIHRLDKDTSGCLLIAKKRAVLREIQAQLLSRSIKKTYWAIVAGRWEGEKQYTVSAPLEKNVLASGERFVKVNFTKGKEAETLICLKDNYSEASFLMLYPKTGRTHQLRVHCAYIGHPILGDQKYYRLTGKMDQLMDRLYLHARSIQFTLHGKMLTFTAELDKKFSNALAYLASSKTV